MHAGRLVAHGSVAQLKEVVAGRVMLEVACAQPLDAQLALENVPGILEASVFGTRLHVVVTDEGAGRALVGEALRRASFPVASIERIVPSLEDVFIHCIEAEEAARAARGVVA
jgi:ABC-2 type transport system ATP-binding protein